MKTVREILERGQEEVLAALEGISDMDAESLHIKDNWTIRDIIGNLTAYEHVLEDIFSRSMLVSGSAPYLWQLITMGQEKFDKFHYEEFCYKPYSEVFVQFNSRHQHIMKMMQQMTGDWLEKRGSVPWYDKNASVADYAYHRHYQRKHEVAEKIKEFKENLEKIKHKPSKKADE